MSAAKAIAELADTLSPEEWETFAALLTALAALDVVQAERLFRLLTETLAAKAVVKKRFEG